MVLGGADGTYAAGVQTGIHTLVVHTGTFWRTLSADHALGSAVRWLIDESRLAGTDGLVVDAATVAVGATWRWHTRVQWRCWGDRYLATTEERITAVTRWAIAVGHMIVHSADGKLSAHFHTRIHALEAHTSLGRTALVVGLTLATATALGIIGIALEALVAVAGTSAVAFAALGVRSTRRWFAW